MKKAVTAALAAACAVAAAGLMAYYGAFDAPKDAAARRIEASRIVEVLEIDGAIARRDERVVLARTSGVVERVLAREAETVREDQLITRIASPVLNSGFRRASLMAGDIDALKARAPEVPDEAYARVLRESTLHLEEQEAAADALNAACARSPQDGVVTRVAVREGDVVAAGTALFSVAAQGERVLIPLTDADAGRVRPGQRVTLSRNGEFIGEALIGEVRGLSGGPASSAVAQAEVDIPPTGLFPGMSVQCAIAMEARVGVSVPFEALRGQSVLTVVNGRAALTPVELGRSDASGVELLRGPAAGEIVIIDAGVKPGERVRPVLP